MACRVGGSAAILPHEDLITALAAVVLALMVVVWMHGIYCYIQMVRHRRPDIPMTSLMWPAEYLTVRGREFRRRALRSYGIFALLALVLILLNLLFPR